MIKVLLEMLLSCFKSLFFGSYLTIKQDYLDFINWLFND